MEKIFYLSQVFNGLNNLFLGLFIFFLILTVGLFIAAMGTKSDGDDELSEKFFKFTKISIVCFLIGLFGMIFVPDKKTYLFMVGGKAVDSIVDNNPEIMEIPNNTLNLLNEYIISETERVKNENQENNK